MEQSDEELEHPAEEDSDHDDAEDLDKMFGNWLGELDTLTKDLDTNKAPVAKLAKNESNLANFRYRFSMHNLHEALNQGEEVDLDALMADLCSMGQELENITKEQPAAAPKPPAAPEPVRAIPAPVAAGVRVKPASAKSHAKVNACDQAQLSLEELTAQLEQASLSIEEAAASVAAQPAVIHPPQQQPAPTDRVAQESKSGDVSSDSTSSRSSLASLASSQDSERSRSRESDLSQQASMTTPVNEEEQEAKLKAEKIKMALEKIKEAQIKKLVVRIHLTDSSSKTMMVDERQTVRQVLDSLAEKSHTDGSPDWSLVEVIPELHMERFFEDSENLVENLLNWTRDSPNMLMFVARKEKYAIFKNPQNYLLGTNETSEMADRNKEALLEECFCGSTVTVPELEGVLYLKEDGKKSWKKRYFLLRASGIYYVPKGKTKTLRDLSCFIQFDHVSVYYGQDFRTKYKAPTEYCFALKHPQIQKKSQYIKYLCCDDASGLQQWVTGIRVAKYGRTMYDNYQDALKRAEVTSDWSSLSSSSMKSASSSGSIPESHSGHTEVGMSDATSGSHTRSQSIVSTMFSEAWRRGTQIEEQSKERHAKAEGDSKANAIPPPPLSGLKPPFQNCSIPSVLPPTHPDSLHLLMGPLPPPPPPLPASFTKLPGVQAMPLPPPPPSMPTLSQPPVKLAAPAQVINYSVKLSTSAVNTSHIPPVALPGHALSTQPIPPQLPPFPAVTQPAVKACKTQPLVQMSACQAPPPPPPPPPPANAYPLAAHSQLGLSARFPTPVSNNHSTFPLSPPRPDEDFPPPPLASDTQKGFLPFPPPLPPPKQIPHHLLPTSIPGERVPSSPSHGASPRSGKRPPPTPQRNSSVKESRAGVASVGERMDVTDTEQTSMSSAPSTQAKPGKLNFAARNIPIVFPPPGSKLKSAVTSPELPPPPPPEEADFPPPPFMNVDCLPPPPELPLHAKQPSGPPATMPKPPPVHMPQASKVACGQESPLRKQAAPSSHEGPAPSPPKPSSTKAAFSQKKVAPPTLPKRSDSTRLSGQADAPGSPPVLVAEALDASNPGAPGSPSALSAASPSSSPSRPGGLAQASFIADLNRTLKRKSLKQHVGSPMHGPDDTTLPPPPPELLREPDSPSVSPGVSRYATLRRAAAPPPPPKRDNSTRLTHD
ncbi:ras-associated and pleckstrin homology domains-containing protein 1 isoform X2 [Lethenteron reissneri]|uniref:ras-associated and pleckstrin homology domains-containing protein 1 isoform X2 n=1 Tax=Lethenteron reissneri TaxID=7753 RepID=UPI002AB7AFED|nr:ras-associated and pleckstrin homology domains-containing protein 1 isoform X2 [Lethenteron reissneri]